MTLPETRAVRRSRGGVVTPTAGAEGQTLGRRRPSSKDDGRRPSSAGPHEGPLTCQRPDRDVARLVCGYPLPCPHHTTILDPLAMSLTIPLDPDTRLGQIAEALRAATPLKSTPRLKTRRAK